MEMEVITINSRDDLHKVINEIGDLQRQIETLRKKVIDRTTVAENWAIANPKEAFERGSSDSTGPYDYALEPGVRAVKPKSGHTKATIVELMENDETMSQYVYKSYDTAKIGAAFGGSEPKRKSVEKFGIFFTKLSKSRLVVGK